VDDGIAARPVGLRERKRVRTRHDLAEAALALFAARGYDETTIEEIADAAMVSPRTFFRYFGSKEELLFAYPNREHPLFFIVDERFKDALSTVVTRDPAMSDVAALELALEELAPHIEVFRERIMMLEAACASSAALRGRRADAGQELERWVIDAVSERRGGVDEEAVTVAALTMSLFRLAVARWLAADGGGGLVSYLAAAFRQGEAALQGGEPLAGGGRRRAPG